MKLNTFLKQFDKITDNNESKEFLKKHLKRFYVPFIERNNAARRTVEATHIFDNKYKPNTQLFEMFKDLDFVELFTDIQFDRIVDGQAVSADIYDELMSRDIIDGFKTFLTFEQRGVWESTYYDTIDDLKYSMTSTISIIDDISKRIDNIINTFNDSIDNFIASDKFDSINNIFEAQDK